MVLARFHNVRQNQAAKLKGICALILVLDVVLEVSFSSLVPTRKTAWEKETCLNQKIRI